MPRIKVANVGDIAEDSAIVVDAEVTETGDAIAVFFSEGDYFAIDDTCTHEAASLAEGWIEDCRVECPIHAAEFCLRDGTALTLPATVDARTHRIEIEDGEIVLYPGESTA